MLRNIRNKMCLKASLMLKAVVNKTFSVLSNLSCRPHSEVLMMKSCSKCEIKVPKVHSVLVAPGKIKEKGM